MCAMTSSTHRFEHNTMSDLTSHTAFYAFERVSPVTLCENVTFLKKLSMLVITGVGSSVGMKVEDRIERDHVDVVRPDASSFLSRSTRSHA